MKKSLALLSGVILSLLFVTWVAAADMSKEPAKDKEFVNDAAVGGMMEVEAGKMAVQKTSNADVKKFGQKMMDDHTKANQELSSIAEKKGFAAPKMLDDKHRSKLDKLNKMSGPDFDKEYMEMMVKDHKDAVALFEKEAKDGKDADIKAFASKTLPTLQEHLRMAEDTNAKVKGKK